MIEFVLVIALAAGFYVGWNIGANDAANCVGTSVGGRVLSYRRAILLVVGFVILGAMLEGWKVMKTIGEGIVTWPEGQVNPFQAHLAVAVGALIAAGAWVTIATTLRLPVSTSQSIVGAVVGAGLLLSRIDPGIGVNLGKMLTIIQSWILTPAGAAFFAYLTYAASSRLLRRVKNVVLFNRIFSISVVATASYMAYALGANDVGNSTGIIYAVFGGGGSPKLMQMVGLFGGAALAFGALTYSRRVMHTVGTAITALDPTSAFSAQFGAALTVHLFTQFGIPVSTTQAIVGAVAGAGLVRGVAAVSRRKLGEIGIAWALTPTTACALTFALGMVFLGL